MLTITIMITITVAALLQFRINLVQVATRPYADIRDDQCV